MGFGESLTAATCRLPCASNVVVIAGSAHALQALVNNSCRVVVVMLRSVVFVGRFVRSFVSVLVRSLIFAAQYLGNGWRQRLGFNAPPLGNDIWRIE